MRSSQVFDENPRSENLLVVGDLSVRTPQGRVLTRDVSFSLRAGEYVLFKGENGTGKSTLAHVLLGRHRFYEGNVSVGVSEDETAYLPQLGSTSFFLPLTLADVMGLRGPGSPRWSRAVAFGLLESSAFSLLWDTASGGERQKALIMRALLGSGLDVPRFLILDEPFNHLDFTARERVASLLVDLLLQKKLGLILISHDGPLMGLPPTQIIDLDRSRP